MVLTYFKKRRRRALLASPMPGEWLNHVEHNVRQFKRLSTAEQAKLCDILRIVVAERYWEGCGGLQMSDEIKVTIAGQACLLLLGVEGYYFDSLKSVLVYPGAFTRPADMPGSYGGIHEDVPLQGESWERGPIVLSWDRVLRSGHNTHNECNLVLHEFAHFLDGLDGKADGTPPLETRGQYRTWHRITEEAYRRLLRSSQRGQATLLDHYGATNHAEFFAVATECFFERPVAMRRRHAALYEILQRFYHQDPAVWFGG